MLRRSELEELQRQAGQITDESLESTRRMLGLMEESEDAGRRTVETLAVQSDQLRRIEQGMDYIKADVTKAEQNLNNLKSCCNACSFPWKKAPILDEPDMNNKSNIESNPKIIVDQPQRLNDLKSSNTDLSTHFRSAYIERITYDAREDEIESNLSQVNMMLGNMRNMAVTINSELIKQNEKIERITTKGDDNTIRLNQANNSAIHLLNT